MLIRFLHYAPVVVGAVQLLYAFIGSGQTAVIGTTVLVIPLIVFNKLATCPLIQPIAAVFVAL
jgi:hypothetical protein